MQVFLEHFYHMFGFACSEHSVIDKNAGELFAYGFVQKNCRNRGIHAAGKPQDDSVLSHLLTDFFHGMVNEGFHGPGFLAAANSK